MIEIQRDPCRKRAVFFSLGCSSLSGNGKKFSDEVKVVWSLRWLGWYDKVSKRLTLLRFKHFRLFLSNREELV